MTRGYPDRRKENVESGGPAQRPARPRSDRPALRSDRPALRSDRHRYCAKKLKIYKNFIPLPLAFWGWIGPQVRADRFLREECGMDAIYLLILAGLYGVTHALVWAFERLRKTS
jgi:hypothetical protein